MTQIGQFVREKTGFFGTIRTLALDLEVFIVSVERSEADNAPDYRLHITSEDGPEIGAGWSRSSEKAGEYISIQLDDPTIGQPIRANLFRNGGDATSWSLLWSRARDRGEKD